MTAYSVPEFAKLRAASRANIPARSWLAALRPTKFEVYWRTTYEEKRRVKKQKYYAKNRTRILAKKRRRDKARRMAKGKKK